MLFHENPTVQVLGLHIGLFIKFRVPQKLMMQETDDLRIKKIGGKCEKENNGYIERDFDLNMQKDLDLQQIER